MTVRLAIKRNARDSEAVHTSVATPVHTGQWLGQWWQSTELGMVIGALGGECLAMVPMT